MKKLSSSLRARSAESTLSIAKAIAAERGITRVTDTTWLDKIGIPVCASIRPYASKGSLAVHAEKGLSHIEAEIGAYMEAIEFSFAQEDSSALQVVMKTPREISASISSDLSSSPWV